MSFRMKLMITMLLLVSGITGATVFVTQSRIRATYNEIIQELFQVQIQVFREKQNIRLRNIQKECKRIAGSVRLFAALEEGEPEIIYQTAGDEMRTVSRSYSFYRLLDAQGRVLKPSSARAGWLSGSQAAELHAQMEPLGKVLTDFKNPQSIEYLALMDAHGKRILHEVVITKILSFDGGEFLGGLIMGFPLENFGQMSDGKQGGIASGILLSGEIYSTSIPAEQREMLAQQFQRQLVLTKAAPPNFQLRADGTLYRADYRVVNPDALFPQAYQISLYSLDTIAASQQNLVQRILAMGGIALGAAVLLSLLLSHGFSVPILELVRGTRTIREGNLDIRVPVRGRDELGQLAASFNEMAEGLALKEKYRTVLNMVTDKEVAEQLTKGSIHLGGEIREISVLFCDIRGFTARTQGMDPTRVIRLLNEHMTALTKIVHDHHGVVDKFVGDLIMAIFGAPKQYGADAENAARCAREMIRERARLNETVEEPLEVGIGIATGAMVVGCMGSSDRLNYTVLGERVNLASRLCSQAKAGQIIIDQETQEKLKQDFRFQSLEALTLKGFSKPVLAYQILSTVSA